MSSIDNKEKQDKKPRKSKKQKVEHSDNQEPAENIQLEILDETVDSCIDKQETDVKEPGKKRGRKPKGGKLIIKSLEQENQVISLPNIILHLKCSSKDVFEYDTHLNTQITDPLSYKPLPPPEIMTYNDYEPDATTSNTFSKYENSQSTSITIPSQLAYTNESSTCRICSQNYKHGSTDDDDDSLVLMKDITMKLKQLRIQYFKNTLQDKKSACFWCTYEFDSPPCYIPKQEFDKNILGYGSFCRPECAVGYLMKESLDDSTKFERYHLLNRIYSKAYAFKKNIKPAPNPHYLLDKFYGSLSIQEYRKLLNSDHMMLVLEKPMTRILPELHEDNEEFILNIYGTATEQTNQKSGGMYKVKRQSEKQQGPTKTSIMKNNFGITN